MLQLSTFRSVMHITYFLSVCHHVDVNNIAWSPTTHAEHCCVKKNSPCWACTLILCIYLCLIFNIYSTVLTCFIICYFIEFIKILSRIQQLIHEIHFFTSPYNIENSIISLLWIIVFPIKMKCEKLWQT